MRKTAALVRLRLVRFPNCVKHLATLDGRNRAIMLVLLDTMVRRYSVTYDVERAAQAHERFSST
jgi:hypothetical protein